MAIGGSLQQSTVSGRLGVVVIALDQLLRRAIRRLSLQLEVLVIFRKPEAQERRRFFLTHLAVQGKVVAATQNHAKSALHRHGLICRTA
jgi:hypothetical protein